MLNEWIVMWFFPSLDHIISKLELRGWLVVQIFSMTLMPWWPLYTVISYWHGEVQLAGAYFVIAFHIKTCDRSLAGGEAKRMAGGRLTLWLYEIVRMCAWGVTVIVGNRECLGVGVIAEGGATRCMLPVPWGGSAEREGKSPCVCARTCVCTCGRSWGCGCACDTLKPSAGSWEDGENPPSLTFLHSLKFTDTLSHSVVSKTLGLTQERFKLKYSLCLLRTRAGN